LAKPRLPEVNRWSPVLSEVFLTNCIHYAGLTKFTGIERSPVVGPLELFCGVPKASSVPEPPSAEMSHTQRKIIAS
jgi:hypothetical protein